MRQRVEEAAAVSIATFTGVVSVVGLLPGAFRAKNVRRRAMYTRRSLPVVVLARLTALEMVRDVAVVKSARSWLKVSDDATRVSRVAV